MRKSKGERQCKKGKRRQREKERARVRRRAVKRDGEGEKYGE